MRKKKVEERFLLVRERKEPKRQWFLKISKMRKRIEVDGVA